MQFRQRHGHASIIEINQGCLGCSASTSPFLVSLSVFQLNTLDAEDNGHAHNLLVGCFCMQGAAQGKNQLQVEKPTAGENQLQGEHQLLGTCSSCANRVKLRRR